MLKEILLFYLLRELLKIIALARELIVRFVGFVKLNAQTWLIKGVTRACGRPMTNLATTHKLITLKLKDIPNTLKTFHLLTLCKTFTKYEFG